MNKSDFLLALDELLELSPGTLNGTETLDSYENWDSLAVISFIALADEKFSIVVGSEAIAKAQTVNDLLQLISSSTPD